MNKYNVIIAAGVVVALGVIGSMFVNAQYTPATKDRLGVVPTAVTVANGGELAITTSYLQVTPSNVATATLANATYAGQFLVIENVGTNNLVFGDNGTTLAIGGTVTLGATDTLTLIANAAAQWREIATANN